MRRYKGDGGAVILTEVRIWSSIRDFEDGFADSRFRGNDKEYISKRHPRESEDQVGDDIEGGNDK